MRLLQIGGGNIGRGYMAQLFSEAGYEIVFADAVPQLVAALQHAGSYTLRVLDAYRREAHEQRINVADAVDIGDADAFNQAVAEADVIATAVGVPNLPKIAPALARALSLRHQDGGDAGPGGPSSRGSREDADTSAGSGTSGGDTPRVQPGGEALHRSDGTAPPAGGPSARGSREGSDTSAGSGPSSGDAPGGSPIDSRTGPSVSSPSAVNIFLCENTLHAGRDLRAAVERSLLESDRRWLRESVGFVGTSVARMVPVVSEEERARDPLLVVADAYRPLPYDEPALRAPAPAVPEFEPRANFAAEVARKLFLYNMCHASLAYLGFPRRFRYVHETLEAPDLRDVFVGAAGEVSRALEAEYPHDITPVQNEHILQDILVRYGNPLLRDTIARVGRDPIRKLGREDRLIGALTLCDSHGIAAPNVLRIVADAFAYRDPDDESAVELERLARDQAPGALVELVTGLTPEEPVYRAVVDAVMGRF